MSIYIYIVNCCDLMDDMANILLVDDDEALLELGKEFIADNGQHTVITANSVGSALDILDTAPVDIIVSDYQMPEADGIEFLRIVRRRKDRIPFILFTGRGREEVVIDAINEGADFYIEKNTDIRSQYAQLQHTIEQAYLRKQAEDAVDYNLNLFKQLIENSMDIIVVVNDERLMEYVSPSVNRILGYQENELIGHDWMMFLRPEVQESIQRHEIDSLDAFEYYFTNFETRKKDGSWATVEYIGKTFERGGHKRFVINLRDISERVETDRQLQLLLRQIGIHHGEIEKESQKGLVGGVTYDFSTRKVSLTPKAAEIFGLDVGSWGVDLPILETLVHPDDRGSFIKAVINESQTTEPVETRYRIDLPSGDVRNINMISCTMMDKDEVPTYVHCVIRDCTEMVRLQEKIMTANMMH
jgi:PAS domain S-box-containing protein